jgi:hypothetical protein
MRASISLGRFREASTDHSFRAILDELKGDLAGYLGLNAPKAVARLQGAPVKA